MFSLNQDKAKHPLFFSPPTSPHVPPFQRTPPPRCDASALPILAAQTFDCSRLHLPHHSRRTTEQTCAPKTPQRLSHSLSHKHTQRRDRNKHQRRTKPMEKTSSMPVYYKHKALTQSARARARLILLLTITVTPFECSRSPPRRRGRAQGRGPPPPPRRKSPDCPGTRGR